MLIEYRHLYVAAFFFGFLFFLFLPVLGQRRKLVKGKRIRIEGSGENAVVRMIED